MCHFFKAKEIYWKMLVLITNNPWKRWQLYAITTIPCKPDHYAQGEPSLSNILFTFLDIRFKDFKTFLYVFFHECCKVIIFFPTHSLIVFVQTETYICMPSLLPVQPDSNYCCKWYQNVTILIVSVS